MLRYAPLCTIFACLMACPSTSKIEPKPKPKPKPSASSPVQLANAPQDTKRSAETKDAEGLARPAANSDESGASNESGGASGESGEESGGRGNASGEAEKSEARAKADLERAGNLALDLTAALKSNRVENLLALTPLDEGEFAKACAGAAQADKREVVARTNHCFRSIDWSKVSDVRVTGGEPLPEASECTGYSAHKRVRMLVVQSGENTEIDLMSPFGKDGQAIAFSGGITCKPHGS